MAIIELCPQCGTVAYPVPNETVNNLAGRSGIIIGAQKWNACTNKECKVAYYSLEQTILVTDIDIRLWYKDDGGNVPICYCSKLSRDEIRNAVLHGCSTIDDVQNSTGKDITGKCLSENPLGQCCRNVFLRTIREAKGIIEPKEGGVQ